MIEVSFTMIFYLSVLLLARTTSGQELELMGIINTNPDDSKCNEDRTYNYRRLEDFLDGRLKNRFGITDRGPQDVIFHYADADYDNSAERSPCVNGDLGLSMRDATLMQNNLGGKGPDSGEEVVRYYDVGMLDEQTRLDLVVRVEETEEYVPARSQANGLVCGSNGTLIDPEDDKTASNCYYGAELGQLSMKRNTKSTFVFQLYEHKSNMLADADKVTGFVFSVFRVNGGSGHIVSENLVIKGWTSAQYDDDNSEAYFSVHDPYFCGESPGVNCLLAVGTHKSCKAAWARDPFNLNEELDCKEHDDFFVNEKARSFQVTFEGTNTWKVEYYVRGPPASEGKGNRAFRFAFNSAHSEDCTVTSSGRELGETTTKVQRQLVDWAKLQGRTCDAFHNVIDQNFCVEVMGFKASSRRRSRFLQEETLLVEYDGTNIEDYLKINYGANLVINLKTIQEKGLNRHLKKLSDDCDLEGYYAFFIMRDDDPDST